MPQKIRIYLIHFCIVLISSTFLPNATAALAGPNVASVDHFPAHVETLRAKARKNSLVPIIVELNIGQTFEVESDRPSPRAQQQREAIRKSQRNLLDSFRDAVYSVTNIKQYELIPYIALHVNEAALTHLAKSPLVASVGEDIVFESQLNDSVPMIGADKVWPDVSTDGYTGSGWYIAVLDSGIDSSHTSLIGKVEEEACYSTSSIYPSSRSLCPNGGDVETGDGSGVNCDPSFDGCYHGTHVAGIAAGLSKSDPVGITSIDPSGVAKGAKLISIQVVSQFTITECGGKFQCLKIYGSDLLSGLERVHALSDKYPIAAINLSMSSLSSPTYCDKSPTAWSIDSTSIKAIEDIVITLRKSNIVTIAATGNDSLDGKIGAPACLSSVVAVGAVNHDGSEIWIKSNHSDIVDLVAPGEDIYSTVPYDTPNVLSTPPYMVDSGTSMATPHVAGAWAIIKEAVPDATIDQILNALKTTGLEKLPAQGRPLIAKPLIQVDAAIRSLLKSSVTGFIFDYTTGQPVVGAVVNIVDPNQDIIADTTNSLGDGSYRFEGVVKGDYYLQVLHSDYNPVNFSPLFAVDPLNGKISGKNILLNRSVAISPSITDLDPPSPLTGLPLPQRQPISIIGSGFNQNTRLIFNDGVTEYDRVPVSINETGTELQYNIAVGTEAADWTVTAYNGSLLSNAYPFSVTAGPTAPIVSLITSPPVIAPGDNHNIGWASSNADTCQASGGWSGSKPLNGSEILTPLGTSVYVLTCTGSGGSTTDVAAVSVTGGGDIGLSMTASPDPLVAEDYASLTYTLTVSNRGTEVLTGVVLSDDVPQYMVVNSGQSGGASCSGGWVCGYGEYLTWTPFDLGPGESRSVQFVAQLPWSTNVVAGTMIHNVMTVTDAGGHSASLAKDVVTEAAHGFELGLAESQNPAVSGSPLMYTIRYGNRSGGTVNNAVLSVPVPVGTSFVSASEGAVFAGGAVQWSLGTLAVGEGGERQLTVNVTGSVGDVLVADAMLQDSSGVVPTQRAQTATEIKAEAPLLLTMTANPDPLVAEDYAPLTYTLTVSNRGTEVLTGVVLRDDVPQHMLVDSGQSGGASCIGGFVCGYGEYLTWAPFDLEPGESRSVQFVAQLPWSTNVVAGTMIHNVMTVTDAGGHSASLAKDVVTEAAHGFELGLAESQDPAVSGSPLMYTIRYGNRSGGTVNNAVLSVPVPVGTSFVSASEGAVFAGGAVQWSLGALAVGEGGERQLTVNVTGSVGDVLVADAMLQDSSGVVPTQRAQTATEIKAEAPLLLTMTASPDPLVAEDYAPLTYTLTVSNRGTEVLTGVVLRDDVPQHMLVDSGQSGGASCIGGFVCGYGEYLTWAPFDLEPGESRSVQFVAQLPWNTDVVAGTMIHNVMTVTDAGGHSASLAKDVVTVAQAPAVTDTDGDGLLDSFEVFIGTDPTLIDTDGDGLSDFLEVAYDGDVTQYSPWADLNPISADTDSDGVPDGIDPLPRVYNFANGDLAPLGAPDGNLNAADYLVALRIVLGQIPVTELELSHGDVFPPRGSGWRA